MYFGFSGLRVWILCFALIYVATLIRAKGTFSLKVLEYANYAKKRIDGSCCGTEGLKSSTCSQSCTIHYRICIDHFHVDVNSDDKKRFSGNCLYGNKDTPQWGNSEVNSYNFERAPKYDLDVKFAWPRSFALILEAYDSTTESKLHLIDRVVHRGVLVPNNNWHKVIATSNRANTFVFSMQMTCDARYYNWTCTKHCDDRNGNYKCNENGDKICNHGWMGSECDIAICKVGCHNVHGSCKKPGECICAAGWEGAYCDECIKYPGCKHGTCNNSPYTCVCFLNWGGQFCDKDENYCGRHQPCLNGGICKNKNSGPKQFECVCPRGYKGEKCEIEIPPCSLNPCKNGNCLQEPNPAGGMNYVCDCKPGWTGINCQENIDGCKDHVCQNGGTCRDLEGVNPGYQCICPPGYHGVDCHLDSPCSVSSCENAINCIQTNNDIECQCQPGWTGKFCSENIDDCEGKCKNNGECHDLTNGYYCSCQHGFSGRDCEINEVCASNPCMNRGICNETQDRGFKCECPEGFSGKRCEISQSGCNPNPCLNAAYCYSMKNSFYCKCADSFYGRQCEHKRPNCTGAECDPEAADVCAAEAMDSGQRRACGDHGVCVSGPRPGEFRCECEHGFKGEHCEQNRNDCGEVNPCMNGGTCLDEIGSYQCLCEEGFEGNRCERKVNLCEPNPCQNGAHCMPGRLANDFDCQCVNGYSGRWCHLIRNANPCEKHTCFNGGRCQVDNRNSRGFHCQCPSGWTGSVCHIRISNFKACSDQPCLNGGTCVHVGDGYNCICKEGFQGTDCETDVNECNPLPCYNNGKCKNLINSFKCECPRGFIGPNCQININECASNPCAYNSTCIDKVDSFECRCPEGRDGKRCEKVTGNASSKRPSCVFHRRVYDHGEQWVYNCQRCLCDMGKYNCTDEFCGYWSCRKAKGPNDRFACKPGEICHALTTDQSKCFVPPCFEKAVCINAHDIVPPIVPHWAGDAGPSCRPNAATLNNHCARLYLTFNRAALPYGVTVDDVCSGVRDLRVVGQLKGRVNVGISCDIFAHDKSVIEVTVSSTSDSIMHNRPIVHRIADNITSSLGRVETNNSALLGILSVRVETLLLNEDEYGPRYLIPLVTGVAVIIGVLIIILLFVYHNHQKKQILMKYAPYSTANNIREQNSKDRRLDNLLVFGGPTAEKPSAQPLVGGQGFNPAVEQEYKPQGVSYFRRGPQGGPFVGKNTNISASRNISRGRQNSGEGGEVVV